MLAMVGSENIQPSTEPGITARQATGNEVSVVAGAPAPPPKRKFGLLALLAAGGVLLLLLLGAVYWFLAKPSPAKYTGPVEGLRIGNVGEYSIFNLIAKDKDLFKKHGLDAEITEYASGPPGVADLLAGKVDVTIAADFVGVSNIFAHPNLRILSQVSEQTVFQVIARKDKGIAEPADLKRKRVGVTKKGAGEFFLGRFATFNDLQVADLIIVDLPPADMMAGLKSGELDAIVIFEPHAYNIKKELGDQVVSWSAQDGDTTLGFLYTTDEFIKAHPQTIKRYLMALAEAEDFLNANPTEAEAILARSLNYDPAYVEYLWPKIDFKLSLQQKMLLNMEDEARFAIENKLTDQTTVPNYLNYIYFAGLESVRPETVTIIH